MTDEQYEKEKKRLIAIWDKWHDLLDMGWWNISRIIIRGTDDIDPNSIGKTSCTWQYRSATITFYIPVCADVKDEELEEAVVHEFVHVLAAPIHDDRDDQAREITEHTITTIARSIISTRKGNGESKIKSDS